MLLLLSGIIILIISTDLMIKNSIILSNKFKISLTVVSILIHGILTSFPELMISIKAAKLNHPEIIISDVIGSNIINLTLILGFSAVIKPIIIEEDHRLSGIFTLISVILVNIALIVFGKIDEVFGLIFISFFILYIYLALFPKNKENERNDDKKVSKDNLIKTIIFLLISIIGVYVGPNLVIHGSLQMSEHFNVSNEFIGITIISLGTSLPELITSIQAQRQNKQEIIIGNIIGSNIFNILLILGVSSLIIPITLPLKLLPDIILMSFLMIIGIFFGFIGKIRKKAGIVLIFIELIYLSYTYVFTI